jgi:hypothetical protein
MPVDVLGRVARGLGAGLLTGLAGLAVVGLAVRTLQDARPPGPTPTLDSAPGFVLVVGTFAAAIGAAVVTWTLLRPIGNVWRRSMLALLAAFGSLALSLAVIQVDAYLRRGGLAALALLAGWGAWRVTRPLRQDGAA